MTIAPSLGLRWATSGDASRRGRASFFIEPPLRASATRRAYTREESRREGPFRLHFEPAPFPRAWPGLPPRGGGEERMKGSRPDRMPVQRVGIEGGTKGVALVSTRSSPRQFPLRPYSPRQFPLPPYTIQQKR